MNSLTELVLDSFHEKIINQKFSPGTRLVEQDIANELKISRTPVRAALSRMEQDGLLKTIKNVGTFVRDISIDEILDIYEIRAVLEGLAVRLFITSGNSVKYLNQLEALVLEFDRLIERNEFLHKIEKADIKFHDLIISHCNCDELKRRITNGLFLTRIFEQRKNIATVKQLLKAEREEYTHDRIFTAIKNQKGYLAEKFMRKHVIEGKNKLLEIYLQKK